MLDVTPLNRVRFDLHSDDPSFRVERLGRAKFLLSGHVGGDPTGDVTVDLPDDSFDVVLAKKQPAGARGHGAGAGVASRRAHHPSRV